MILTKISIGAALNPSMLITTLYMVETSTIMSNWSKIIPCVWQWGVICVSVMPFANKVLFEAE